MKQFTASQVRNDFVRLFQSDMDRLGVSRSELAIRMGVSRSRVTQMLNGSSNLRITTMLRMTRALKMKLALVGYVSDHVVEPEAIRKAWLDAGKPRDFWELKHNDSGSI